MAATDGCQELVAIAPHPWLRGLDLLRQNAISEVVISEEHQHIVSHLQDFPHQLCEIFFAMERFPVPAQVFGSKDGGMVGC